MSPLGWCCRPPVCGGQGCSQMLCNAQNSILTTKNIPAPDVSNAKFKKPCPKMVKSKKSSRDLKGMDIFVSWSLTSCYATPVCPFLGLNARPAVCAHQRDCPVSTEQKRGAAQPCIRVPTHPLDTISEPVCVELLAA